MRILLNLALVAISCVVALLFGELALRVTVGPPIVWKYPQENYVYDPQLGHWLEPGQVSYTHDKPVQVNSVGLRDRDYPPSPAPGVRRVLALGDSQTFGSGLDLEHTWPKQLEARLRELAPETQWEILNAGLTASDTWHHEFILARLTEIYDVDTVILGFYINDVSPRPKRAPRKLSRAARTNTWTKRIGYLAKRSAVLTALWQARMPLQAWLEPNPGVDRETRVLSGDLDPELEKTWATVEESLAAMRARTREIGAEFRVLIVPRRDQVDGGIASVAYQAKIRAITARLGIPTLDALPPLRRAHQQYGNELFIPWDGHNSARANGVIADELAAELLASQSHDSGSIASGDGA